MHFSQMFFFLSFSAIVLGAPRPSEDIDSSCGNNMDGTTGSVNKRGGADADQWYSTGC